MTTKAFISYSWDSDDHKLWVRHLAERLQNDGVEVTFDQWHLVPGDQLPQFMEQAVRDSDFVLIVCTHRYKERTDSRAGGVGYEGDIMSGEAWTKGNQRKFIPILREPPWPASAPSWLIGKYYIDLSVTPYSETQYGDLLATLLGMRRSPPTVGRPATANMTRSATNRAPEPAKPLLDFEPIKITGIIVDQVGTPRGDGTRGSGLYDVPFRLSRRPPPEWADLFVAAWDHPPRWTNMHRPGIASVAGDTVHLNGTTIREVQEYHRETLRLAAEEANTKYLQLLQHRLRQQEVERQRIGQHRREVEEAAKRINFD